MTLIIDMDAAAWGLAAVAAGSTLVRLLLGVLAAHATRKALRPAAGSKSADRLRAHRLAVLCALLHGLHGPRR